MATPPRANFYDVVLDLVPTSATYGKPISNNIQVSVYLAPPYAASAQTTLASLFSAETGATTPGNPFSLPMSGGGAGELNFWAAPGSYDLKIVDSSSPKRFADKLVRWDADPSDKGMIREMFDDSVATQLGLNNANGPTVRRGAAVIPTSEIVSAASYTLMPTPDRVSNIKLETNGIIWVAYYAEAIQNAAGGKVGLFFGSNQVQQKSTGALANLEVALQSTTAFSGIVIGPGGGGTAGLVNIGGVGTSPVNDATTGQSLGPTTGMMAGWAPFFAAAGTYDVSVRYLHSGGNITAKNRRLYVKSEAF